MKTTTIELRDLIRDVPDFPKPGIIFKDITPLLKSPEGFRIAVEGLAEPFRESAIDRVAGIESRGFIFGAAVAQLLGCGFVPIRKPGKLPWKTSRMEYSLEYGVDALEVHEDAFSSGERVLIVDDLLATGGTAEAAGSLVTRFGAELVAYSMVVELRFLNGRQRLGGTRFHGLIDY